MGKVKTALKRWYREGQKRLLQSDPARERLYLQRLEALMLSVPACREILLTHAASDVHDRTGLAMAQFFYGAESNIARQRAIARLQTEIAGDYMSMLIIDGEEGSSCTVMDLHHYFYHIPGKPYMIAHEYVHMSIARAGTPLGERRSGFAYPALDGTIHRLMVNHNEPLERSYDVFGREYPRAEAHCHLQAFETPTYRDLSRTFINRVPKDDWVSDAIKRAPETKGKVEKIQIVVTRTHPKLLPRLLDEINFSRLDTRL
jgi:hypothetical protein